jgi:DNA-binding NarL/FixJ family response regulator
VIRVVLADDHAAIRAGLRFILEQTADIEVVGEAVDGDSAIVCARTLRPDVVVMDVRMPGTDGVAATAAIVEEGLADVLVLTTFDFDDVVFGALRAGAAGFLLKTVEPAALIDAVRVVAAGDGIVAPEVTRRLLSAFVDHPARDTAPGTPTDTEPGSDGLTPRERAILGELGRGLSNAQIAARLVISEATVKTHVSRVLAKLGVASRMQAAIIAREKGLV